MLVDEPLWSARRAAWGLAVWAYFLTRDPPIWLPPLRMLRYHRRPYAAFIETGR